MPKFAKFKLTISSGTGEAAVAKTYYFDSPENTYDQLSDADTGVEKVTDPQESKLNPSVKIEKLLLADIATAKKLRLDVAGNKDKYKSIIVASDKSFSANAALIGQGVDGAKVISCYTPTKRHFY